MFYNSGGIIRKNILKSRKNILAMGLGPKKLLLWENWVFWSKMQISKWCMGGYVATQKFYFRNSVSSLFRAPICQIMSFGAPHSALQHYFAEKRPL